MVIYMFVLVHKNFLMDKLINNSMDRIFMGIFIIRLKPNTEKYNIDKEDQKQSSAIHHDYVEELVEKNIILFGGPVKDIGGGLIIANLPTEADVMKTFLLDPMISKEYVTVEISEWDIKHNTENFNKLLTN